MNVKVKKKEIGNGMIELSCKCQDCGKTHRNEYHESLGVDAFHFQCCQEETIKRCECGATNKKDKSNCHCGKKLDKIEKVKVSNLAS